MKRPPQYAPNSRRESVLQQATRATREILTPFYINFLRLLRSPWVRLTPWGKWRRALSPDLPPGRKLGAPSVHFTLWLGAAVRHHGGLPARRRRSLRS